MQEGDQLNSNHIALLNAVSNVMKSITSSIPICPPPLRLLCEVMKISVARKFPKFSARSVAGFLFLRFFNPVIVAPDKIISNVRPESRRKLILVSKVLQNIANGLEFGDKEEFMKITNPFIVSKFEAVESFVDELSKSSKDVRLESASPCEMSDQDVLYSLNFMYTLVYNDQRKIMPLTENEAIRNSLFEAFAEIGTPPLYAVAKKEETQQHASKNESFIGYAEFLKRSETVDFSAIAALNAVFLAGQDSMKRPIVVVMIERFSVKQINMDDLFLYIIKIMDPIVEKDYVLIYVHTNIDSSKRPSLGWLKNAYTVFNRKYKKNLKELYIIEPSWWLKVLVSCFKPFVSTKFWKKLHYIGRIEEISSEIEHFDISKLTSRTLL